MKKLILMLVVSLIGYVSIAQNPSSKVDRIVVENSVIINLPINKVWSITANDFAGIDKWNTAINVSQGKGESINELDYNTRICMSFPDDPNAFVEKITEFDSKNKTFTYQPLSLPPGWNKATSRWTHTKKGNATELKVYQTAVFNKGQTAEVITQVKGFMSNSMSDALEELKVYIETGKPTQKKADKIAEYKDKLSRGAYSYKVFPPFNSLEGLYDQHLPSPLVATNIKGNGNYVKIIYSRPSLNGRTMLGENIPYGEVWRLGANEQTEITAQKEFTLGGKKFEKGTYALFAIPYKDKWQIIVNRALGDWGAFNYDTKYDLHAFEVPVKKAPQTFEKFTIWFADDGSGLNMAWADIHVILPLSI